MEPKNEILKSGACDASHLPMDKEEVSEYGSVLLVSQTLTEREC